MLDDPWGPAVVPPGSTDAADRVRLVVASLTQALGVPPEFAVPLFEDPLQRILDEARAPAGDPPPRDVDPATVWLAEPEARARLVARLDAEEGNPVGWAVPLHRAPDGRAWATTRWTTRRGRVLLVPGTSPAGLRLPLASISWTAGRGAAERPAMTRLPPLPAAPPPVEPVPSDSGAAVSAAPAPPPRAKVTSVKAAPTTALCVEERDGHVFVFLPPVEEIEPALELLAAVEDAAARCGIPVVLEGYPLPGDPRVRSMTVTPDPGVVEVNVRAVVDLGRAGRLDLAALPPGPRGRSGRGEVRHRRHPHGHRRRLPPDPRRPDSGRTARCCAGPTCWSAC